jgi:cytochrome d ubiquinol oxidase subunit II
MLIGIVLRGSAFVFRSYGSDTSAAELRWGRVFAIASVVTPLLLGACIGALVAERVPVDAHGSFTQLYVAPWLTPFSLAVGVFTLALFAFLAAVYLTVEARGDPELQDDFRRRALAAALAVFVCAFGVLLALRGAAPRMQRGLTAAPWSMPLHVLTAVAAITAIGALWTRRFALARAAAAAQVSLILWGWVLAQFPYIVPPSLTIAGAAAPERTLSLTLIALAIGALVLFPSLYYLFRIFKSEHP